MVEFAALEVKVEAIWWQRGRDMPSLDDGGGGGGGGGDGGADADAGAGGGGGGGSGGGGDAIENGKGQSVVFRLHFILYAGNGETGGIAGLRRAGE